MRLQSPGGEQHPLAKFRNCEAEAIAARYLEGETTMKQLAADARVSKSTVRRIVRGITYRER